MSVDSKMGPSILYNVSDRFSICHARPWLLLMQALPVLLPLIIAGLGFSLSVSHNSALQARTGCVWECLSPEGFTLNSKWNEAEKYICNPQSGEFPKECLSAKTLSGRSLHNFTSRITMSAPLAYPSSHQSTRNSQAIPSRPPLTVPGPKFASLSIRVLFK